MELFQSYKEAHEALRIPGSFQRGTIGSAETGILSLKLTENPKSLDRVSMDFERIYYVGIGKKSSQGEPAEDQTLDKQQPFFKSLRTQTPFPVLIKLKPGIVLYTGNYTVSSIHKKQSQRGFTYYQVHLQRAHN